jgi:hypothetical protein
MGFSRGKWIAGRPAVSRAPRRRATGLPDRRPRPTLTDEPAERPGAEALPRAQTMRTQMKFLKLTALAVAAIFGFAIAEPAMAQGDIPKLQPASPQPDVATLKPGLAVRYTDRGVRELNVAISIAGNGVPGPPLVGFDYPNTMPGENALTSDQPTEVVAKITGFIRFEEAGVHELEFLSNDGLSVKIEGESIYRFDYRMPCSGHGPFKVEVPQAGFYALDAVFFQRYKTSCLLMKVKKPSSTGMVWASNEMFFYKP